MNMLKTYETEFLQAIYEKGDFSQFLASKDYAQNFDIYINNCFLGLVENLQGKFPICEMILGNVFFENAAQKYIAQNPQRFGENNSFGDNFPNFIGQIGNEFDIQYIGEIAQIEWQKFNAEIAPFEKTIDFEAIANSFANGEHSKIKLRECLNIISTKYNVFDIYVAHLNDEVDECTIIETPQNILIWVDEDFNPQFKLVTPFAKDLINQMNETGEITIALSQALSKIENQELAQGEFIGLCNLGIFTIN